MPTTKEGACIKHGRVQVYDLKGVQGETERLKFAKIERVSILNKSLKSDE